MTLRATKSHTNCFGKTLFILAFTASTCASSCSKSPKSAESNQTESSANNSATSAHTSFANISSNTPSNLGQPSQTASTTKAPTAAIAPPSFVPSQASIAPLQKRTYAMVVDGDIVHAGTTAGVVSWDYSNRHDPKVMASAVVAGSVQHLAKVPKTSLLAVSTGPTGVAIVDTSNIRSAKLTVRNPHPWSAQARNGCLSTGSIVAPSVHGFVACGAGGVGELDISDPANPSVRRRVDVAGYVRDIALLDEASGFEKTSSNASRLIAAAGLSGIALVDFQSATPRVLATLDVGGDARAVQVANGHAFVAAGVAGLAVVDVRSPRSLSLVTKMTPKSTDMARGIAISNANAILCLGDSGLVVADISQPKQPKQIGLFDPPQAINRAVAVGNLLYIANDAEGIALLDISKPHAPKPFAPLSRESQDPKK